MENLNTDRLMIIQVEQLEKEKKDLNARLRVTAKRIDHTERAFRKEERPLLDRDYEEQQANDRETFDALQRERIAASKLMHELDLETKKRLSRMMGDYLARKQVLIAKRGEEFKKRKDVARRKIEEEKNKRRMAVNQEREEERKREEEEERKRREIEEEQARLEAGTCDSINTCIELKIIPQNALLRKNINKRRRRPSVPLLKPRNARRKKRRHSSGSSAKRSVPLLLTLLVCNVSVRKQPRHAHAHERRNAGLPPCRRQPGQATAQNRHGDAQ